MLIRLYDQFIMHMGNDAAAPQHFHCVHEDISGDEGCGPPQNGFLFRRKDNVIIEVCPLSGRE